MTSWNKSAEKFDYVNQTLEFVGNISSGSQTLLMSKMIQSGLLEMLMPLLEGHNKQISKIHPSLPKAQEKLCTLSF